MAWSEDLLYRDCTWCGVRDIAMRQFSHTQQAESSGRGPRWWAFMWCPRCGGVVAVEHTGPQSSRGTTGKEQEISASPSAAVDHDVHHLPPDVDQYYKDALRVLDAGVPDAAAVQLRRALEAAATHHGVESGNLVNRIEKLIKDGKITTGFGPVLHHIRQVGNLGAHATDERLDEPAVRRALNFTTQVLRNLFEVPGELARLEADPSA